MATAIAHTLKPKRTRILLIVLAVASVLGSGLFTAQRARGAAGPGTEDGIPAGGSSQAHSQPWAGSCEPTILAFVENTSDNQSTKSFDFVDLPGASVTFTQGGAAASCVEVDFTAMTFAAKGRLLAVRPLLDGAVGAPSYVQLSGDDDENADGRFSRSHAFNFMFRSVAPGSHTLRMQFASLIGGNVYVHRNGLLVRHHR